MIDVLNCVLMVTVGIVYTSPDLTISDVMLLAGWQQCSRCRIQPTHPELHLKLATGTLFTYNYAPLQMQKMCLHTGMTWCSS